MIPRHRRRAGRAHLVVLAFVIGAAAGWGAHALYASASALARPAVDSVAPEPGARSIDSAAIEPGGGRAGVAAPESGPAVARPAAEPTERRIERLRRLTTGEPDERLALAREVLAEPGVGPLTARASSVLVELDPDAAVTELLARVEAAGGRPAGLGLSASMIERLGRSDALTAEHLERFYEAGTVDVRVAAARVAAERGDESLVDRFLASCGTALAAAGREERVETVRSLALLRSPGAAALIAGCFEDEAEEVRLQAVRSTGLGQRDPVLIDGLRRLADDPSERVRQAAARQLEMLERMPAIRRR